MTRARGKAHRLWENAKTQSRDMGPYEDPEVCLSVFEATLMKAPREEPGQGNLHRQMSRVKADHKLEVAGCCHNTHYLF